MFSKIHRYYHTLRYLRPVQIWGRLWRMLPAPSPNLAPAPVLRSRGGVWIAGARRRQSLLEPGLCCFLNEERNILGSAAWNDPACEKLWLYNLHYFDDLNAEGAERRESWHHELLGRWVRENPPGKGNGWEPYPCSLRICNWVKWALTGNELAPAWRHSLAVQARWLSSRLEWHLLGNHLFANAKALVFAGCFFSGPEADSWLAKGVRILRGQIPEQILSDGGQFERSPMYHAIALEDMLDLVNLAAVYRQDFAKEWCGVVGTMRRWLACMTHPDGNIAFFNDAAFGVAPAPAQLEAYARRLGFPAQCEVQDSLVRLEASGYIRLQEEDAVALLDVGPVGPDYLPGHAHADTLSCELSCFGQRVLVNSGTSVYGTGKERARQRGTAAHNTVCVAGEDSSEVWGGFRVARRARPVGLHIERQENGFFVSCAHDGYLRLPGRPQHCRQWHWRRGTVLIEDTVLVPSHDAVARWHVHPAVRVTQEDAAQVGTLHLPGGQQVRWRGLQGQCRVVASTFHPEFGMSLENRCLEVRLESGRCAIEFNWHAATSSFLSQEGRGPG